MLHYLFEYGFLILEIQMNRFAILGVFRFSLKDDLTSWLFLVGITQLVSGDWRPAD
jgi:hypothetical protein